jgi:hypothetical protein
MSKSKANKMAKVASPLAAIAAEGNPKANQYPVSQETLREGFIQASENARAYMDLRFKHFGTFVVLTGLLGTAISQADGFVLTILFWILDFRTSHYLLDEFHRIRVFKEFLSMPATKPPTRRVLLRASHTTSFIFLAILLMWGIIVVHSYTSV